MLRKLEWLISHLPFLMNDSAKIQHFSLKNNSCPESRASLSRISCIPSSLIMYLLDATRPGLGASALSGRVPTYRQLRPNVPPTASRCIAIYVPMYRHLRPDVSPSASGRGWRRVGTQFWGHRAHSYLLCGLAGG